MYSRIIVACKSMLMHLHMCGSGSMPPQPLRKIDPLRLLLGQTYKQHFDDAYLYVQ